MTKFDYCMVSLLFLLSIFVFFCPINWCWILIMFVNPFLFGRYAIISMFNSHKSNRSGLITIIFFPIITILACSGGLQLGLLNSGHQEISPDRLQALYFSIITWTTLGYGDFVPTNSTRIISVLLAVSGYLYASYFIGFMFKLVPQVKSRLDANAKS